MLGLPRPLRAVARQAVWTFGKATSQLRALPDFLIIGAQKAGTTSLYAYLRRHPRISGPWWKETSYFDVHYHRGRAWYRGHFPPRFGSGHVIGEASPSYVFHPRAPIRARALLPEVRLIVLLRDPADRALSHYEHEVALGREPLSFEEALAAEEERMRGEWERIARDDGYFSHAWWNHTYLARGRYAEQLERWVEVFPREQLLVLISEELFAEPARVHAEVLHFLGVERHELESYPRMLGRDYGAMRPETRGWLEDYYEEPNRRLAELLGRELPWGASPWPRPAA